MPFRFPIIQGMKQGGRGFSPLLNKHNKASKLITELWRELLSRLSLLLYKTQSGHRYYNRILFTLSICSLVYLKIGLCKGPGNDLHQNSCSIWNNHLISDVTQQSNIIQPNLNYPSSYHPFSFLSGALLFIAISKKVRVGQNNCSSELSEFKWKEPRSSYEHYLWI